MFKVRKQICYDLYQYAVHLILVLSRRPRRAQSIHVIGIKICRWALVQINSQAVS